MSNNPSIVDTWVRPVGRTDVAPLLSKAAEKSKLDIYNKGKRPGDLFRTADDLPIGSLSLSAEKSEKGGFGKL